MIESEACSQHFFNRPLPAIGYGKFDAGGAPTANDDESAGYSVNSMWYKATVPYRLWICTDNTDGFAVWREIQLVTNYDLTYLADTVTYLGDQVTHL